MTLMAGIVSRTDRPLETAVCRELARSISRNPHDQVIEFRDRFSYFAKIDIGAFGTRGIFEGENAALSLLTGEPILANESADRFEDLAVIHSECLTGNWDVLRDTRGTFSLAHYVPRSRTLSLISDKLGVRPLYFWIDDDCVVFASALRILEALAPVPKKMDLRAVTEMAALGAPLSDRTAYEGVSFLTAGHVLQVSQKTATPHNYWRWDQIATSNESEPTQLRNVYRLFQTAIERRIRNDRSTTSYLSGGLDSRCVVAALRARAVSVRTVNFARPGTQDFAFGNEFAAAIGSAHHSVPKESGDNVPDYSSMMARFISVSSEAWHCEHPRLVWSGEGGSVLLGAVHLNESIIELMRAGRIDEAIETYLKQELIQLPLKIFQSELRATADSVVKDGIRNELKEWECDDAGRRFYFFLMHNDQRRKLADHFENIDLHRLEFQLPFFDATFLEAVVATPLDSCLGHQFYARWLSLFPEAVTAVPWQTYPGHAPCPLSSRSNLAYQWNANHQAVENEAQRLRFVRQAAELLAASDFPRRILNKRNLRLAAWIHSKGWRNYQYAIETAQIYHMYARKCGSHFTF
jgi:asparagine synthase (glutamine-hydrolysing)